MGQQGPHGTRHLVGQRHDGHILRPAASQAGHPCRPGPDPAVHRTGSVNQQGAKVGIATLADAEYTDAPTGAGMPGHETQLGGKLASGPERPGVAHGRHCGRRTQHTHT